MSVTVHDEDTGLDYRVDQIDYTISVTVVDRDNAKTMTLSMPCDIARSIAWVIVGATERPRQ